MTPFNDSIQTEYIIHLHPGAQNAPLSLIFNQSGTLLSEIEFYIGMKKKDFNAFFVLETENGMFRVKSKSEIVVNEPTDIMLKFYSKPPTEFLKFNNNTKSVNDVTDFVLLPNILYSQYIYRIPSVNAHNIVLNFQNPVLISPDNTLTGTPASRIYATDEYLEVSFVFWNRYLVNQVIRDKIPFTLIPNAKYIFIDDFSIEYETFRWEWIITIILSSVLAIFTFIIGAKWGRTRE